MGHTAVKLSGAEAANQAQCAAPDKPIGYWNLLVVFANLKRVIQCACFKSLGSRKGTPKCNLRILAMSSFYQENDAVIYELFSGAGSRVSCAVDQ